MSKLPHNQALSGHRAKDRKKKKKKRGRAMDLMPDVEREHQALSMFAEGEENRNLTQALQQRPPFVVQTLVLSKDTFDTQREATKWAQEHDFKADKVDETDDSFRLRQRPPGNFTEGGLRTIELDAGVQAVGGRLQRQAASLVLHQGGKFESQGLGKFAKDIVHVGEWVRPQERPDDWLRRRPHQPTGASHHALPAEREPHSVP